MYENALKILQKIKNLGYEAYIVGGYSRDKYLGINSYDIDICTNMVPEEIKQNFNVTKDNGYGSVVLDNEFETTTYRKDIYSDSRYPKIEYVNTLNEDLMRRDFIINTLCIDYNGNYIDLLGATKDIDKRIIRTVKNSDESFIEDPLRIVRALRFKLDLKFELNNDIIDSINKYGYLLNSISDSRIRKEIEKSINKEELYRLIGELYETKSN